MPLVFRPRPIAPSILERCLSKFGILRYSLPSVTAFIKYIVDVSLWRRKLHLYVDEPWTFPCCAERGPRWSAYKVSTSGAILSRWQVFTGEDHSEKALRHPANPVATQRVLIWPSSTLHLSWSHQAPQFWSLVETLAWQDCTKDSSTQWLYLQEEEEEVKIWWSTFHLQSGLGWIGRLCQPKALKFHWCSHVVVPDLKQSLFLYVTNISVSDHLISGRHAEVQNTGDVDEKLNLYQSSTFNNPRNCCSRSLFDAIPVQFTYCKGVSPVQKVKSCSSCVGVQLLLSLCVSMLLVSVNRAWGRCGSRCMPSRLHSTVNETFSVRGAVSWTYIMTARGHSSCNLPADHHCNFKTDLSVELITHFRSTCSTVSVLFKRKKSRDQCWNCWSCRGYSIFGDYFFFSRPRYPSVICSFEQR